MPRRSRSSLRASYFHVINRSANGMVLFTQPADYRAFLSILGLALEQHPIRLIAYSMMPKHWHLVLGPTDSESLSRCVHWVTATHASRLHHGRHPVGVAPVYHGAFNSLEIPAAGHLMRVCRQVERTALEARLVRRAQDWPWASLSERLRPACGLPIVNAPFLSSRAWADYVNSWRPEDAPSEPARPWLALHDFAEAPGRFA